MSQHSLMAAVNAAATKDEDEMDLAKIVKAKKAKATAKPKAAEDDCDCVGEEGCECDDSFEKDAAKLKAAVLAERKRIMAIQAAAFTGQDELVSELINSGASAGDAAMAFNKDQKAKLAGILKALDADEEKVKGLRSEYAPANGPVEKSESNKGLTGEPKWKADYASDAKLKSEFFSEEAYVAFKRAEAKGRVRILNKQSA